MCDALDHRYTTTMAESRSDPQQHLIARLGDPTFHGPHCRAVRVVETHISYVVLTGTFAYKIKKAVDLGFVDFRTLAARRFYCQEEIRLNRRLAPSMYLDVVDIAGTPDQPRFGKNGAPFEFAVRMREFPQHALLSAVIARGALTVAHVEQLGDTVAAFHRSALTAHPHTRFGTPADVRELALDNFVDLQRLTQQPAVRRAIDLLHAWTEGVCARIAELLAVRRRHGLVRECHGDLHLGNIALLDGVPTPFDCIEFSERMRWSDVMSDVAFLVMDLQAHGRRDLASHFLNRYLEETGDYEGLAVLRFFVVYRALVRAKVACLRATQTTRPQARASHQSEAIRFIRLAASAARSEAPAMVITHGPSGSGKTSVARALAASLGAIHIRADVERKRLFGVPKLARTGATIGTGIYSAEATRRTYQHLATVARLVTKGGYRAIIDAAFLMRWQRDGMRTLAGAAELAFVILDCTAPLPTLAERVALRNQRADDASEADGDVLVHQMETAESLQPAERPFVVYCDTAALPPGAAPAAVVGELQRRMRAGLTPSPLPPGTSHAG
jgi:uncharacterized protein